MLRDERAVLLDTETTGLGERDVVIELALLSATEGTPLLNTLIRPDRPIPWDATLRHLSPRHFCLSKKMNKQWMEHCCEVHYVQTGAERASF